MTKKGVFGTYEWAASTANCAVGCQHDCKFCYAKTKAIRAGLRTPKTWCQESISGKAMSKKIGKRKGTIMFPTLHDLTPNNLAACVVYLERLLSAKNNVLIVSKPHLECIEFLCRAFSIYKNQILFRFTIGSANNDVLQAWEPGAPPFEERVASLKIAFEAGYKTSISCEPMLDDKICDVICEVEKYVTDAIWLGKANKLIERMIVNGASEKDLEMGRKLVSIQNDVAIKELYQVYKDHLKIKWKESIKTTVGIEVPTQKGLDI